jgi:YggT family protein
MGNAYVGNAASFLISTILGFLVLAALLRLMFAWVRADFYNPLSQFVVKVTNWGVLPLRRIIPAIGRMDSGVVVFLLGFQILELALIVLVTGYGINPLGLPIWAIGELLGLIILVLIVSIFIEVILSWVNPGSYNPMTDVVLRLNRPILEPARRMLPDMGGFDLSPLVAMVALQLVKILLVAPITDIGMGLTLIGGK